MTGSAQHTGTRRARAHAALKVTPITRAVRSALALSATVLALSTPAFGAAGDACRHEQTPAVLACGATRAPAAPQSFVAPVDLTVVRDGPLPSSVYVAAGAEGIAPQRQAFADADPSTAIARTAGLLADPTEILNDVTLRVDSAGDAVGIGATGSTRVRNTGGIYADGYTSAIGVDLLGTYAGVDNAGTIAAGTLAAGSGYAPAIGVRAFADDTQVHNDGSGRISAIASTDAQDGWARARAVYAVGFDGVSVENLGDIHADARADNGRAEAHGIYAFGYGSATSVDNAGDINVSAHSAHGGAYATGINAIGYAAGDNVARVTNAGSIRAASDAAYAYAFGVLNLTRQRNGSADFSNEGDIHAEATGGYATATGSLNLALRYGDATSTNTGTIDAIATGDFATATGLYNYALVYDATVVNDGVIAARADAGTIAIAVGLHDASSLYGATAVENAGSIAARAQADTGLARAAGVVATSERTVDLTNTGPVDARAYSVDGPADAFGLYGLGTERVTMLNYGDVVAAAHSTHGDASAYGAFAFAGFTGIGLLINGGDISAQATAGAGQDAAATGAMVIADVASIFNDGDIAAAARAGEGGTATAVGANAYGMNSAVYNYGQIDAYASADGGSADAIGAMVYGYNGASFLNAGDIAASVSADGGVVAARGVSSIGIFSAYATNTGSISAAASGGEAVSHGLYNASVFDAITVNEGSITAVADGTLAAQDHYEALAFGAYNLALYYNSVIANRGSIVASASSTTDISGTDGFLVAKALGATAISKFGYGETGIYNTGSITALAEASQGYAGAWGAVSLGGVYGTAWVDNAGAITAYAHADIGAADAVGAYVSAVAGSASVVNHGDITAIARAERGIVDVVVNYAEATGLQVLAPYGEGQAEVQNYGTIAAHTNILGGIGYATGINAYATTTSVHNAGGADIVATVEAELFGGAFAMGIEAGGQYHAEVTNDGSILAYAHANAYSTFYGASGAAGIYVNAGFQGDAQVMNNGDVTAVAIAENSVGWAQGGAGATAIHAYGKYDATIVNAGDVTAIAQAQFGNVAAYGLVAHGKYSSHLDNQAGASVFASATVGSLAGDQSAGIAIAFGAQSFGRGSDHSVTYNGGSIVAHALVTPDGSDTFIGSLAMAFGASMGYNSSIDRASMTNVGSIEAAASADYGYASAYGAFVRSRLDSGITNAGDIRASASADGGNAFAVGTYAFSLHRTVSYNCDDTGCDWANPIITIDGGASALDNSGDILATAGAEGGTGYSYGAVVLAAQEVAIGNTGDITAVTEAGDARAYGVLANSFYGQAQLLNGDGGVIAAQATGDTATAHGVMASAAYGVELDNAGTILAAAYGADASAIAVTLAGGAGSVLDNTGTIVALGDGERIAIEAIGGAAALSNRGDILGAIRTGDGNDRLDNAAGATWHAVGVSDFGAGDNTLVNHGLVFLDDATLRLGAIGGSHAFDNFGTLAVSGRSNRIDMGGATLANAGVISFIDGQADDVLTVAGDFAGQGALQLDVSGLNQSGDRLYVEGAVVDPAAQRVDVNLLDLPDAAHVLVPLLDSTGALGGDFVLGDVDYAGDGFLSMDFGLDHAAHRLSLVVDVTGLNATGSLAASLAPGVQSLVNAQVGSWRQRMGVVPPGGPAGLAPWVRAFGDSGEVTMDHHGNFGAGGQFGFRQSNHGWELGLDTQPTAQLSIGALLSTSDGNQRVDGAGQTRLDGRTFGLYATWLTPGFYLDVSHRWTGVDARLQSAAAHYDTEASATTLSVEAGLRAWSTQGGLNIVPQLQYVRSDVSGIAVLDNGQGDFRNEGGVSERARLGVSLDRQFEAGGFTWTPYGSVNALHEFDGDYAHALNGGLLGTVSTQGTSAQVELGLGARRDRFQVTGGLSWTDGGALEGIGAGQLVLRYSW